VRPLKNHIQQAVAALKVAAGMGLKLRFHINASRIECNGEPIIRALQDLFNQQPNTELVKHTWLDHPEFLHLCAEMDLCTQVSYSESFNITIADAVSQGVPVVGSSEIPWLPPILRADPSSATHIASRMRFALVVGNVNAERSLRDYADLAQETWLSMVRWFRPQP
jgi:hypothetical protein